MLRKCVEVAKEGGEGSGSGRIEVRARALLAEVGLGMGGQGMVNEVEKTLSKAVSWYTAFKGCSALALSAKGERGKRKLTLFFRSRLACTTPTDRRG